MSSGCVLYGKFLFSDPATLSNEAFNKLDILSTSKGGGFWHRDRKTCISRQVLF